MRKDTNTAGQVASAAIEASTTLLERVESAGHLARSAWSHMVGLDNRVSKVETRLQDAAEREEIFLLQDAIATLIAAYESTSQSFVEDEILRLVGRFAELVLPKTETTKEGS